MNTHELKIWPEHFGPVLVGRKTFEIRRNDRNYQVGDTLILREFDPCEDCMGTGRADWDAWDCGSCLCRAPHGRYTGRELRVKVTYTTEFMLADGYIALGIKKEGKVSQIHTTFKAMSHTLAGS